MSSQGAIRSVLVVLFLMYHPVEGLLSHQIKESVDLHMSAKLYDMDISAGMVEHMFNVPETLSKYIHLQLRIIHDDYYTDPLINLARFTVNLRGTTVTAYEEATKDLDKSLTPTADEPIILLLCSPQHILDVFQQIKDRKIRSMKAYWLFFLWNIEDEVWILRKMDGLILEGTRIGLLTKISRSTFSISTSKVDLEGVTRFYHKTIMDISDMTDTKKQSYLSRVLRIDNNVIYSNMERRRIRVTSHDCPVFTFLGPPDERGIVKDFSGIEFSILRTLSEKLNFTFDVYDNFGSEWGDLLLNGTVTGFIGKVHRREVDVCFANTAITQSRAMAVDFTVPNYLDTLGIMTKAPTVKNPTFIAFSPFTMTVWICIASMVLIAGFILRLVSKATEICLDYPSIGNLQTVCFSIFRVTVMQGNTMSADSFPQRIIFGFWYIFCLIVYALYSGILIAVLAIPSYEKPYDSLTDIPRAISNGIIVGTHRQTVMEFLFRKATGGIYKDTWLLFNHEDMSESLPYYPDGYDWVTQKDFALIETKASMEAEAIRRGFRRHYISKEYFFLMWISFACTQGAPFKDQFDRFIQLMVEGGLVFKYKDDEFRILKKDDVEEEIGSSGPTAIKLIYVQAAFYIILLGMLLSTLVFLAEIFHSTLFRLLQTKE